MKRSTIFRIAGFLLGLIASTAAGAIEQVADSLPINRLNIGADGKYAPFAVDRETILGAMSSSVSERYEKYLDEQECDNANRLLIDAFQKSHPQFARFSGNFSIIDSQKCGVECANWLMFLERNFREVTFCAISSKFDHSQRMLDAQADGSPKYPQSFETRAEAEQHPIIASRDANVDVLALQSNNGYLPATLKLLDLVQSHRDVFGVKPDGELFLILLACGQGAACGDHQERIAELTEMVGTQRTAEIRKLAAGFFEKDRYLALLAGKDF